MAEEDKKKTKKVNFTAYIIMLTVAGIMVGILLGMLTEAFMIFLVSAIIAAMGECTNALVKAIRQTKF